MAQPLEQPPWPRPGQTHSILDQYSITVEVSFLVPILYHPTQPDSDHRNRIPPCCAYRDDQFEEIARMVLSPHINIGNVNYYKANWVITAGEKSVLAEADAVKRGYSAHRLVRVVSPAMPLIFIGWDEEIQRVHDAIRYHIRTVPGSVWLDISFATGTNRVPLQTYANFSGLLKAASAVFGGAVGLRMDFPSSSSIAHMDHAIARRFAPKACDAPVYMSQLYSDRIHKLWKAASLDRLRSVAGNTRSLMLGQLFAADGDGTTVSGTARVRCFGLGLTTDLSSRCVALLLALFKLAAMEGGSGQSRQCQDLGKQLTGPAWAVVSEDVVHALFGELGLRGHGCYWFPMLRDAKREEAADREARTAGSIVLLDEMVIAWRLGMHSGNFRGGGDEAWPSVANLLPYGASPVLRDGAMSLRKHQGKTGWLLGICGCVIPF